MVISLQKVKLPYILITFLFILLISISLKMIAHNKSSAVLIGGVVHTMAIPSNSKVDMATDFELSRFLRPSAQTALKNTYSFKVFEKSRDKGPLILNKFQSSEDVILAFFGILQDAANMVGYSGGCGTIGWATIPYPYAYELLTADSQKNMWLKQFEDSFKGIGHITLLKLYPAFTPPETPENIRYHMVEAEVITGAATDKPTDFRSGNHFAYFYGIITTEQNKNNGWKVKAIDYFPEDFLCHPMHGWDYDAQYLVPIIYQNWYHLIDKVDKTEQNGDIISIYASGEDKKYRFDFVRITNGTDVLLREMVSQNGKWVETNLLKDEDQVYKLSVLNPNLNGAYPNSVKSVLKLF